MPRALIVEDDAQSQAAFSALVESAGFEVRAVGSLEKARLELEQHEFDLVLTDLKLPDGESLELGPELEETSADVIFVTGEASVDSAVEAFRGGAVDYLTKPPDMLRLKKLLAGALRTAELRREVDTLRGELRELGRFGRMVGHCEAMQRVYDQILKVAKTEASVFVTGETGTGKELVAETVHGLSARNQKPFVAVNCGALSPNLIESELFGHEKGSFTGAARRHEGFFEQANGGTLFLDEVTEMPLELQVKLLRVLETGQVRRIGADAAIDVDVRIVAATNSDPHQAVADEILREDLLYRLLVFPIELPPLRERGDDVELIALHMLANLNKGADRPKRLSDGALARLKSHEWPGNVRELQNTLERAYILADDWISAEHLPLPGADAPSAAGSATDGALPVHVGMSTAEAEKVLILATLEQCDDDKKRASELLGVSLKTLYNRLNAYKGA